MPNIYWYLLLLFIAGIPIWLIRRSKQKRFGIDAQKIASYMARPDNRQVLWPEPDEMDLFRIQFWSPGQTAIYFERLDGMCGISGYLNKDVTLNATYQDGKLESLDWNKAPKDLSQISANERYEFEKLLTRIQSAANNHRKH